MDRTFLFRALADATLVIHFAFVLFVLLGLIATLAGGRHGWAWVRDMRWRAVHLAAIGVVTAESWLGMECPLTTLELWLRRLAGQTTYSGDFIAFWLRRLLFFEAPAWVFVLAYSVFALLVAWSWWRYPPRRRGRAARVTIRTE